MDNFVSIVRHIGKGILFYTLLAFLVFYGAPSFATEVNHYSSDDGYTQFNLPFDFELYGQSFDTARMYTNGVVQFGDQGYQHFCCHGEEYGGTGYYQQHYDISYTIMPLWTDIYANNSNSRQYTENNGTSFTFGWEDLREYNRQSTNTFDVTIDDTGSWYVEYDAIDILNHNVTVGSVGDYEAQEWDQYTYRTYQQDTTLSDVNGYTGYTVEQEEQTIVQQFTSDGICDYTAIEDPDCTTATETFTEESYTTYSGQSADGSIIDDGQDDGSTTDTYTTVVTEPIIVYQEDYSNNTSETTIASDGQDSGDTLGDTGEETYEEAASEQSQEVYEGSSTQDESNVVYMENEQVNEPSQEQNSIVVTEEAVAPGVQVTPTLNIDPNAALNADAAFASKQRTSSFRRSVNSRAVAHLNAVGGLPTIGATSAEQYQSMTSSGSTVNGMLVNQEMANDPSRMYAPANPSNPTGTGTLVADASGAMNSNTFDPNQTGMYGVPNSVDNQALSGMIVASESPMGDEIELEEALSTSDLGGLGINDFKPPKLEDQSNWYSDQNSLAQESIYRDQDFYKQQDIYKGVTWYGNN